MRSATFALVLALSGYVLFRPDPGGPPLFASGDKVVHASLFAALAVAGGWRFGRRTALFVALVLYAVGSEIVQAVTLPQRSGDPLDAVADVLGALLGWLARQRPGRHDGSERAPGSR